MKRKVSLTFLILAVFAFLLILAILFPGRVIRVIVLGVFSAAMLLYVLIKPFIPLQPFGKGLVEMAKLGSILLFFISPVWLICFFRWRKQKLTLLAFLIVSVILLALVFIGAILLFVVGQIMYGA